VKRNRQHVERNGIPVDMNGLPVDRMPDEDEPLFESPSRQLKVGKIDGRHQELNPVDHTPVKRLPANQVQRYNYKQFCPPISC